MTLGLDTIQFAKVI